MARANRLRGEGGVFHVTYRCHNRDFLLKFARDRDDYRSKLRGLLGQFEVSLLDYEILGQRQRYRLLDLERLCWRLQVESLEEACRNLEVALSEKIAQGQMKREACWTESLAVGSVGFLEKIQPLILSRRETEMVDEGEGLWALQELAVPYGQKTDPKTAAKPLK